MSSSCGKYYYIVSGFIHQRARLSEYKLYTSKKLADVNTAIKVFVFDSVHLTRREDHGEKYYVAHTDAMIENFNPMILTRTYDGWKRMLYWDDIAKSTILKCMAGLGYTYDVKLGYVTNEDREKHRIFTKLLFG